MLTGILLVGCDPEPLADPIGGSGSVGAGGTPPTADDYAECLSMNWEDCRNCCEHSVPTIRWEDLLEQCQCGSCPECNCVTHNNEPSCYACMDGVREHCLGVATAECAMKPACALNRQCKEECPPICEPCFAFHGSNPPCTGSKVLHDAFADCACIRTSQDDPPGCAEYCADTFTCGTQWPETSGCENCLYGSCAAEKEACDADTID